MRKRASQQDIELNVTAMLDMAFQLLAFFIMTFQSPRPEGQIAMHLPPAESVCDPVKVHPSPNGVAPVETLAITLQGDRNGLTSVAVGMPDNHPQSIAFAALESKLDDCFQKGAGAFKQVVIQAGPGVRWDYVMRTMEICSRQKKTDGTKLDKLSFVCLADSTVR